MRMSKWSTATVVISNAATGASRTLTLPMKQQTVAWPEDLSIVSGALFHLTFNGSEAKTVRWHILEARPGGLTQLANALFARRCFDQLNTLRGTLTD